jgi:hypothetical protein
MIKAMLDVSDLHQSTATLSPIIDKHRRRLSRTLSTAGLPAIELDDDLSVRGTNDKSGNAPNYQRSRRKHLPVSAADNGSNEAESESVQVVVRVRPLMFHEAGTTQCTDVIKDVYSDHPCTIKIGRPVEERDVKQSMHQFTFDEAFSVSTTQRHLFQRRIVPLITRCLDGYNATILAYGQTGAGKTHTIMGPAMEMDEESAGVIPRAITLIFEELEEMKYEAATETMSFDYEVRLQFLEIYGEEIRDLVAPLGGRMEKLSIRDAGVEEPEVLGATQHKVESAVEALGTISRGTMQRVTASTAMNASSSRSHAILTLLVHQTLVASANDDGLPENVRTKSSKFNFVDLAGAERQKRTHATGKRLKEGVDINKGLLVLGNVISALGDPKKKRSHVPYRDSKLTRLLKGSLGGNHKTLMIACVSPSEKNLEESLNCLRYANRAKNIQNRTVQNIDSTSKLVVELQKQVKLLSSDLLHVIQCVGDGISVGWSHSPQQLQAMAGDVSMTSRHSSSSLPMPSQTQSLCELPLPVQVSSFDDHSTNGERVLELEKKLREKEVREATLLEQIDRYLHEINRLSDRSGNNQLSHDVLPKKISNVISSSTLHHNEMQQNDSEIENLNLADTNPQGRVVAMKAQLLEKEEDVALLRKQIDRYLQEIIRLQLENTGVALTDLNLVKQVPVDQSPPGTPYMRPDMDKNIHDMAVISLQSDLIPFVLSENTNTELVADDASIDEEILRLTTLLNQQTELEMSLLKQVDQYLDEINHLNMESNRRMADALSNPGLVHGLSTRRLQSVETSSENDSESRGLNHIFVNRLTRFQAWRMSQPLMPPSSIKQSHDKAEECQEQTTPPIVTTV